MRDLLKDKQTSVAVVGATDSPGKYGGIIYRFLKKKGYVVWAVNPNTETVDGDPAQPHLEDLPSQPDIIDFVVPADVGKVVAEEVIELGWDNVWLQPGAESPDLIDVLRETGISTIHDDCIMVQVNQIPG
ncbi:MAG: CoA-binding protein [Acidimicrobiia bacterium]|nr:CoA-binding protein [Acidimicrobiia bacterium]